MYTKAIKNKIKHEGVYETKVLDMGYAALSNTVIKSFSVLVIYGTWRFRGRNNHLLLISSFFPLAGKTCKNSIKKTTWDVPAFWLYRQPYSTATTLHTWGVKIKEYIVCICKNNNNARCVGDSGVPILYSWIPSDYVHIHLFNCQPPRST